MSGVPPHPSSEAPTEWAAYRRAWRQYAKEWHDANPGAPPSDESVPGRNDYLVAWQAHWRASAMPWRTEPQIDEERQAVLAARRATTPNIQLGEYPFKDIVLERADVEWLLETHEDSRGPVLWEDERDKMVVAQRTGLDLRGADLRGVNLRDLPLARMRAGLNIAERAATTTEKHKREWATGHLEKCDLAGAQLEGADLYGTHLEGANFYVAHLQWAYLASAQLQGATFYGANLEGTVLRNAHLEGKRFGKAELARIHQRVADFPEELPPADIRRTLMTPHTILDGVTFGSAKLGFVSVADVRWGGVNLAVVGWGHERRKRRMRHSRVVILGDELHTRRAKRTNRSARSAEAAAPGRYDLEAAARAYRQLATVLRAQSLTQDADRFGYRAQVLDRKVLWQQRDWVRWLFQTFLGALAGYGYRPLYTFGWYLLLVALSSLVFIWQAHQLPCTGTLMCAAHDIVDALRSRPDIVGQAIAQSFSAVHGRGFFPQLHLTGWELGTAAFDAVGGLVIEATFVATFVQRSFGK